MYEFFISVYFVILSLILLVMLVILYKLMIAVGRLDRRLEQLAQHLRDLNLYDFHPEELGVLGEGTELDGSSDSTDHNLTPSRGKESPYPSGERTPQPGSGTTVSRRPSRGGGGSD